MNIDPKDWPSRNQAIAIVEALRSGKATSMKTLGQLSGIPDIELAVQRCFHVYGYPELDRCAEMIADAFMTADWCSADHKPTPHKPMDRDHAHHEPRHVYGFNQSNQTERNKHK